MRIKNYKYIEYAVLLIGLVSYFVLFSIFRNNNELKILFTGIAAIVYSIWGVVHHWLEHRLSFGIAMEYLLISIFVFLLVLTALSF